MKNIAISFAIGAALMATAIASAQDRHDRGYYHGDWHERELETRHAHIVVGDEEVRFKREERPFWVNHTLMVPFRAVGALIGAKTDRSKSGEELHIHYRDNDVDFRQDSDIYHRNGARFILPPTVGRDGVLFVPVKLWEFVRKDYVHVRFE